MRRVGAGAGAAVASGRFPERANRHGVHSVAETRARFTVVQHDAVRELLARGLLEFPQSAKIGCRHGGTGLDLNASDSSSTLLQYQIDFDTIAIAEVVERDWRFTPTGLPLELL